jgi:hypothetical protein
VLLRLCFSLSFLLSFNASRRVHCGSIRAGQLCR